MMMTFHRGVWTHHPFLDVPEVVHTQDGVGVVVRQQQAAHALDAGWGKPPGKGRTEIALAAHTPPWQQAVQVAAS
jgi:hypothetical protein